MYVKFNNQSSSALWLVVGYYKPGCPDGGDWAKRGWYRLSPGQSALVLETNNIYHTYYAEADDGRHWRGEYYTNLPLQAFDWCWGTASTSGFTVGMRLVRIKATGSGTQTWNLT
ncbi:DUF1036 domain-containing protein [Synechococcus sp. 1G10]|uniref:DUF1036 domain-containing protein n=1 Tax=Synechococcus sp. 1G10 TaxID=2025605 RepID=UPI000B98FBA4